MPDITTLLQFAVASVLLAVTPGPSVVLLIAVGADAGRRAGTVTALGLALGTLSWGLVAAAGLGALLEAEPLLLSAITFVGGCYLAWLAWTKLRAARAEGDALLAEGVPRAKPTPGRPFRDGVVVNLLNPAIAIFLGAITPPFLDAAGSPVWQQLLVLVVVLTVMSTVVNVGYGFAGASLGRRARRWAGSARTTYAVAVVYAALAAVAFLSAFS